MNVSITAENTKLNKFKELVDKVKSNIYNLALADEDIKKLQELAKDYLGEVHKSPIWGENNFTLYTYQSQVGTVASTNKKDRCILYSKGKHWSDEEDTGGNQYKKLNYISEEIGIMPIPFFRDIFYEEGKDKVNLILSFQENNAYRLADNDVTVIYMPNKSDLINVLDAIKGGSVLGNSSLLGDYKIESIESIDWERVYNLLKELNDVSPNRIMITNFLKNKKTKK